LHVSGEKKIVRKYEHTIEFITITGAKITEQKPVSGLGHGAWPIHASLRGRGKLPMQGIAKNILKNLVFTMLNIRKNYKKRPEQNAQKTLKYSKSVTICGHKHLAVNLSALLQASYDEPERPMPPPMT
jgi:hypothetical protein